VSAAAARSTSLDEFSSSLRLGCDGGDDPIVAAKSSLPRPRTLYAANFCAPNSTHRPPRSAAESRVPIPLLLQNDGCCSGEMRDLVFLDRLSARLNLISRGDVVVLRSPDDDALITKRVVAMGGDTVRHREHGSRLVRVPTGRVWVEGDNGEVGLEVEKPSPSLSLARRTPSLG